AAWRWSSSTTRRCRRRPSRSSTAFTRRAAKRRPTRASDRLTSALPLSCEWSPSIFPSHDEVNMARSPLDLLQGTVAVLILKALAWQPQHGRAVAKWIRARTAGALELDDAALYQGLHRLERKGWLSSEWGVSENNRRAKFYELTPAGRRQLKAELSAWRAYAD